MATIAFFDTASWEKSYFHRHRRAFFGHTVKFFAEPLSARHVEELKEVEVLSLFVQSKLTAAIIPLLPKLKMVAMRCTGFDNVDVLTCAKQGVIVCNVPSYGENTVAEHTFGLLLSLARYINTSDRRSRSMDFTGSDLIGIDIKGKTIGVIGGGKIGMNVVKIAHGFGMKILVYDTFQNAFYKELLDFEYADLDTIFRKSDIISIHVPYLPQTHHMIDMKSIKRMKKGTILLNCARGGIVDSQALLYGLQKGIIGKAGLDVLEKEELLTHAQHFEAKEEDYAILEANRKIIMHPNVLFTPHNAFNTAEALARIEDTNVSNIKLFLAGKPQNVVKP